MPATKFELVDLSTWETKDGGKFEASPEERDAILEASSALLNEKAKLHISPENVKRRKYPGGRMLVVLANGKPMTVAHYNVIKYKPSDKKVYVSFHQASARGAIQEFSKKRRSHPSHVLFDWMRERVKGPAVVRVNIDGTNRAFFARLEKKGVLRRKLSRPGRPRDFNMTREPPAVTNAKKRRR
ncbi:MAG: hypothetical protein QGI60_01405 [archaeon]|jgi:hypothetical protein|nr:hypothetical protein [archaeon]